MVQQLSRDDLVRWASDKIQTSRRLLSASTRNIDRKRAKDNIKSAIRLMREAGAAEEQVRTAEQWLAELFPGAKA